MGRDLFEKTLKALNANVNPVGFLTDLSCVDLYAIFLRQAKIGEASARENLRSPHRSLGPS